MISPHLQKIERDLRTLSIEELEWLLERITRQMEEKKQISNNFTNVEYMNEQLATMAIDLEIQSEIVSINHEFSITEMDGLERL
ncbi:MAG: hypothetical protein KME21_27000 [Desmonostoc vinosum HA7617-LM4]|jgi:uncharacterized protein (UPF0335 family)|nr:hypothetical protein [Desmonostoc vinosum HA7617-LM4]